MWDSHAWIKHFEMEEGCPAIPSIIELGEQRTEFLIEHAPKKLQKGISDRADKTPYFSQFFKPAEARSMAEKAVSSFIQKVIDCVP